MKIETYDFWNKHSAMQIVNKNIKVNLMIKKKKISQILSVVYGICKTWFKTVKQKI